MESLDVRYEVDGHTDALLESDFVVVSPGVTSDAPIVRKLRDAGIPIFSDRRPLIFLAFSQIPIFEE